MKAEIKIPLVKPNIEERDLEFVSSVIRSGNLVQGIWVEEFEKNVAEYLQVDYAIAVSSGTAALHLALLALGISSGDEVIVPAFSFMATANVIEMVGAKPVFVDIDINTFNINVNQIESAITPRTKAIMPVHEFGLACDISKICEIAKRNNLFVIEDAACALGAKENDRFVGSFGEFGCFSLHPRKNITSGEGGIISTNNRELAGRIKLLRNHGGARKNNVMKFADIGLNYRLTDIQAALVLNQFRRLSKILEAKEELANIYLKELQAHNDVLCPTIPISKNHTWQSFHVLIKKDRNNVIHKFLEKGIESTIGAQCIPAQEYYMKKYGYKAEKTFPNAFVAFSQGLVLPLFYGMSAKDVQIVSQELMNIMS